MGLATAVLIFSIGFAGGVVSTVAAVWGIVAIGREARERQEHNQRLLDHAEDGLQRAHEKVEGSPERGDAGAKWYDWDEKEWH
jgi:hypothetical protein